MKIKRLLSIFLSVLLIFSMTSCSKKDNSNKFKIVTSFYPIYVMALNIADGIDDVEVINLADQNTGCLHDFQLRTEDMKNIETSDVVVINGAGMEPYINKILEESPNKIIIDSSNGIDLIEDDEHSDNGHHIDKPVNSHVWVSISNYINQVKNISEGLISINPENKEKYENNTRKYLDDLLDLKSYMHSTISDLPKREIITLHESFDYFAKEFCLDIKAVINHEPNTEPNSKEIKETIKIVKDAGQDIPLFVEPQYPSTSADVISSETGSKVYALDSCVTGDLEKDSYLRAMRKNTLVLKEALS